MNDEHDTSVAEDEKRVSGLIDIDRLARWMDAQGLAGAGSPIETKFISGGASNEIFRIDRGGETFVLRRPPRNVPKAATRR